MRWDIGTYCSRAAMTIGPTAVSAVEGDFGMLFLRTRDGRCFVEDGHHPLEDIPRRLQSARSRTRLPHEGHAICGDLDKCAEPGHLKPYRRLPSPVIDMVVPHAVAATRTD